MDRSPNQDPSPRADSLSGGTAFDLLAPSVQHQLWRMGWTELRPIQVRAIQHILQGEGDCILSADTAAGKTEAAFLPIVSRIVDEPPGSIRVMYIGPLRALINDQFHRVEDLCQNMEIPVFRWHGDVDVASKKRLLRAPAGILLITPESLESLFVNRTGELGALFGGLRFVVIDELHVFLGSERGLHLASLLSRLQTTALAQRPRFRTVGLSATIGNVEAGQAYLDLDHSDRVAVLLGELSDKEFRFRIHAYKSASSDDSSANSGEDSRDHAELAAMQQVATDLVEHCRGSSNLVFANAKGDLELYADLCKSISDAQGSPTEFLVHHGSLSKEIREDTEQGMKSGRPKTALCSSTMELGIDIGNVRTVGQIGPPWSVASFKQRVGRSGRKDSEPRIARVYVICRDLGSDATLLDRLNLELIQSIAISELLLSGWVEPMRPSTLDLSTLTHQIISVIAETGGIAATPLFDRLCRVGPFRSTDTQVFTQLLRDLGKQDIVEQTGEGELILGLIGERLRSERDFYASFATPAEFAVQYAERPIGMLPLRIVPQAGEHLVLAGRRWKITHVDIERAEIHVVPATGRKKPLFLGGPGEIHDHVRQTMREVLAADQDYTYLTSTGTELLHQARAAARTSGVLERHLLAPSDRECQWFTWMGTRVQTTLTAMLRCRGLTCVERGCAIDIRHPMDQVRQAILAILDTPPAAESIAAQVQPKQRRKYDRFLSEPLLNRSIAADVLDVTTAMAYCQRKLSTPH